jgi:hypothetical protein
LSTKLLGIYSEICTNKLWHAKFQTLFYFWNILRFIQLGAEPKPLNGQLMVRLLLMLIAGAKSLGMAQAN